MVGFFINLEWVFNNCSGGKSSLAESAMLHHHVSIVAQDGQT